MLQKFKSLLFYGMIFASFAFSFGLNLKFFKFLDDMTGINRHRNKIVIRSFGYLIFYYVVTKMIIPRLEDPASATQGGSKQKVVFQNADETASPEPIDADSEKTPGENSKAKE